jgi:hypothetical protein
LAKGEDYQLGNKVRFDCPLWAARFVVSLDTQDEHSDVRSLRAMLYNAENENHRLKAELTQKYLQIKDLEQQLSGKGTVISVKPEPLSEEDDLPY